MGRKVLLWNSFICSMGIVPFFRRQGGDSRPPQGAVSQIVNSITLSRRRNKGKGEALAKKANDFGPLLRVTCGASVGRGDRTPPLASWSPCRRQAPFRPAGKGVVSRQSPLVPEYLPPRVGADLCVRPRMGPATERVRADT